MAVKAGGDEVLHTVMEIRSNPYEDDFALGAFKDKTINDLAVSPFDKDDGLTGGNLARVGQIKPTLAAS